MDFAVYALSQLHNYTFLCVFQSVALDGTLFQKSGVISGGARSVDSFCIDIHVMHLKVVSGRFFFHFREVFGKCIEYIRKFLVHIREI